MRPQCLILDEATAMLDPRGRGEVLETVTRLNKEEGITVIMITHFMEEAVAADRIFILDGGQIAMQGPPQEVFLRVAELRSVGLDVPPIAELAGEWVSFYELPPSVLTVEELVNNYAANSRKFKLYLYAGNTL